jgi:uncharacterized membrane protein
MIKRTVFLVRQREILCWRFANAYCLFVCVLDANLSLKFAYATVNHSYVEFTYTCDSYPRVVSYGAHSVISVVFLHMLMTICILDSYLAVVCSYSYP